jgi:hypothetical protein
VQPQSPSSKRPAQLEPPFPLVKPHEWERRKAQIQRRHPHLDVEFYQDPATQLWTMKTTSRKTSEVKIVAAHPKPYSALHFGMEKLVDRAIIK